jgi:hypothetical protein
MAGSAAVAKETNSDDDDGSDSSDSPTRGKPSKGRLNFLSIIGGGAGDSAYRLVDDTVDPKYRATGGKLELARIGWTKDRILEDLQVRAGAGPIWVRILVISAGDGPTGPLRPRPSRWGGRGSCCRGICILQCASSWDLLARSQVRMASPTVSEAENRLCRMRGSLPNITVLSCRTCVL